MALEILHVVQLHAQILQPKSQMEFVQAVIGQRLTRGEHQELLPFSVLVELMEATRKAVQMEIPMETDVLQEDMAMAQMAALCHPMRNQSVGLLAVQLKSRGVLLQTMEVDTPTGCVQNQLIQWISQKSASSKLLCH